MATPPCRQCKGTLHIPTPHGWARCPCARGVFARLYIKPALRGTDLEYPPEYDAMEPWGLTDVRVQGHGMDGLREFRFMAWRSVRQHLDAMTLQAYDVVEANRLVEVR